MNQELKVSARNEYLNHINTQKTSGLSIVKYCKQHSIDPNKFYYYNSYRRSASKPRPKATNNFTQVKIKPDINNLISPPASAKIKIAVIDPVWLAQFIFTLNSCK